MHDQHWALVDHTRPASPDPEQHAAALVDSLVEAGSAAAVAFAEDFAAAVDALYRWDLWGAAYLALGGCSDDAFADLRAWLVAEGQATWSRAQTDPEGLFVDLLGSATDPIERWRDLGLDRAEVLGYVAGVAHEQATGRPLPPRTRPHPDEPVGESWDDDELAERFPRLAAAVPREWTADIVADDVETLGRAVDQLAGLLADVAPGLEAFRAGDHARSLDLLEPFVDDPTAWSLVVTAADPVDVAYVVGIGRLQQGDPERAAAAFRLVAPGGEGPPHVRRALAQVELALGNLDVAAELIELGSDAPLMARALAAVLDHRRGERDAAHRRAVELAGVESAVDDHPWDVAGAVAQAGLVLVELGDAELAAAAARRVRELIEGSPDELPLRVHHLLLAAGAARLDGRTNDALAALDRVEPSLGEGTAERGVAWRERARLARRAGDEAGAAAHYRVSVAAFDAAGERWEATATHAEAVP